MEEDTKPVLQLCRCGHSPESHIYPDSTLYADCHECSCELFDPPGGLEGVPIHPLFAFTPADFRMMSCYQCGRFRVLPEGVCERCEWDNDNQGFVDNTRPNYCRHSPTRAHEIPWITQSLRANYCRYCLRTIEQGRAKRGEHVGRFWGNP